MIWLAPLFRVIGGGDAVAATMVLAALADVYENEERYRCLHPSFSLVLIPTRTIVFTRVASLATICELISPLIASALMTKNAWIAIILGYTLFLTGATITLKLLPDTSQHRPMSDAVNDQYIDDSSCTTQCQTPRSLIDRLVSVAARSLASIFANRNIAFLLFGFFATTVGLVAAGFELQYVHLISWLEPRILMSI
jgi:hypothetical protein